MNFGGVLCFSFNILMTVYIPLHDFISVCFKIVLIFLFPSLSLPIDLML